MTNRLSKITMLASITLIASTASGETIQQRYHAPVDLALFECGNASQSSFIGRVCQDVTEAKMAIELDGVFYIYCGIPAGFAAGILDAGSPGRFYNDEVKGRFACS